MEYTELRCLLAPAAGSGLVIGGRLLEPARQALIRWGLERLEAGRELERQLLQISRQEGDVGTLLCLRCCISRAVEERLRALQRSHGENYGLELIEMASLVLDDGGELELRLPGNGRGLSGRLPFCWAVIEQQPAGSRRPFSVEVLVTYDPSRCGLPHWSRQKVQADRALKAYLRQQGLLLISDWALLGSKSGTFLREAWQCCGAGSMTLEQAEALHQAYRHHYGPAKAVWKQQRGKASGWQPDGAFLRLLLPDQPIRQTSEQLLELALALRRYSSAGASQGFAEGEEAAIADPASLEPITEAEEPAFSPAELRGRIETALQQAAAPLLAEVLAADQRKWAADPSRQLAWQLYGEGLGQRAIAERCGHQQGWVSKLLREQQLATAIATAAAVELQRQPPFSSLAQSVAGAERLVEALRNHLLLPEREGEVAPLRQALQRALLPLLP